MIKYAHLCRYVADTLWAIHPAKLADLVAVLAHRAAGQTFTPEEIRARIGGSAPRAAHSGPGVAVIPVQGVLAHRMGSLDESSGGISAERIGAMVDLVAADQSISTILYDFDTPGGTVPGIQELAAKMFSLRGVKKQIALVNGMAASAGYWLASQADEIVSIPSGTVGSIGVLAAHEDLSGALEQEGIKVTLVSAGKHKVAGNPFEPLSPEERAVIQARVDEAYGWFIRDVARGRRVAQRDVREGYGEGRAVAAKEALRVGLIDRIDTVEATINRVLGRKDATLRAADNQPQLSAAAETVIREAVADQVTALLGSPAAGAPPKESDVEQRRRRLGLV